MCWKIIAIITENARNNTHKNKQITAWRSDVMTSAAHENICRPGRDASLGVVSAHILAVLRGSRGAVRCLLRCADLVTCTSAR
jgi:hypothetical protein